LVEFLLGDFSFTPPALGDFSFTLAATSAW
jgi:hypothetical protein